MSDSGQPSEGQTDMGWCKKERKGIGCGVFLIIVGVGLFAERMGWFPFSMVWFLPAVFIAWGIGEIYEAITDK